MEKRSLKELVPATVGIGAKADKIITQEAEKYKISKKEYVDACVILFHSLGLHPTAETSATTKAFSKKINTIKLFKELEKNLSSKFLETRNTYVSFIKQMEKEELRPIKTRLTALDNQLKLESKNLSLNQLKHTLVLMDLITDILIDDAKSKKFYFEKFAAKLSNA